MGSHKDRRIIRSERYMFRLTLQDFFRPPPIILIKRSYIDCKNVVLQKIHTINERPNKGLQYESQGI